MASTEDNRSSNRATVRWRALKYVAVGAHRLRDIQLQKAKKPSNAKKVKRRFTHLTGIQAARKVLFRQIRKIPENEVDDFLRDFMNCGELEMSSHIERAANLIEALKWVGKDGRVTDITAEEVYANIERSYDVFEHIYAQKEKYDHVHVTLLKGIKERVKNYGNLRVTTPLDVVVLGGGPIGMRTAVEMALLGHKVTVLECRDRCSRLNVLKLWEETTIDLDRLGCKGVDSTYCNKKEARASTTRLQLTLLKVALLLGVRVNVDKAHGDFDLTTLEGADVLFLATGYRADLLAKFRDKMRVASQEELRRSVVAAEPFQPMPQGRAPAAAIAIVCHFERGGNGEGAKAWTRYFEVRRMLLETRAARSYGPSCGMQNFDWTVQDAKGADRSEAALRDMQQRYGMFCIAPKALADEGIALENIVCYANKGKEPFTAVPQSYYFIFTLKVADRAELTDSRTS
jgi:hypothetical protein|eukprot:Transcript_18935.p1 GENE.Transcript_18935~~Transcript_18935.p1  ORF type:complete len:458 (-),score=128.74 Transcript_18935:919-2292(-)